jgi:hypothetical protein
MAPLFYCARGGAIHRRAAADANHTAPPLSISGPRAIEVQTHFFGMPGIALQQRDFLLAIHFNCKRTYFWLR